MNVEQAAKVLQVSCNMVRRLCKQNVLLYDVTDRRGTLDINLDDIGFVVTPMSLAGLMNCSVRHILYLIEQERLYSIRFGILHRIPIREAEKVIALRRNGPRVVDLQAMFKKQGVIC